jgi:hypothetical protein
VILLVAYHPRARGIQKPQLYATLKAAESWMHYIPGCWLIVSYEEPEVWVDRLRPNLGDSSCFVVRVTSEYQGLLPEKAWAWIDNHAGEFDPPP